jgi:hypothetical protein
MEACLQLDTIQANDVSTIVLHSQRRIISAIFAYFDIFECFRNNKGKIRAIDFAYSR